jgi:uncharacterized membrane protein
MIPMNTSETLQRVILIAATVLTGLFAGLFATFSYAVMPGLRRTDDATFVRAMQQVNVAILNPVFGVVFAGSVVVSLAAVVVTFRDSAARPWAIGALVLVLATLVVTAAVNVPLNDKLADGTGNPAALRAAFENSWVAWNIVRSVLSLAGFVSSAIALFVRAG